MAYTKYSLTPADNNAAPPNGAPEGMLPSAVNDTMRDMMAQIRDCGDGIRGGTYTMTAPVITGGSITGVALSGNTLTNPIVTGGTFTNPVITGGSISGITDLAIADGGTGASTAASARTNLGLEGLGIGNASIMKNRLINGNMVISQRYGTTSTTPSATGYSLDRWNAFVGDGGSGIRYSFQQVTTAPAGFGNSIKITTTTSGTSSAGDRYFIQQPIEGFNTADLGFGTANAKTFTISFWVQSSLTGTFGGAVGNANQDRSYPFTYTISAANTWEQKAITIAGDTSGTWEGATNGIGLNLFLNIATGSTRTGTANTWAGAYYTNATGSVNLGQTASASINWTGVQLEVGSSATGFEYRQYTTELELCQRYFQVPADGNAYSNPYIGTATFDSTTTAYGFITMPVTMRTTPTLASTASTWRANIGTTNGNSTTAPTITRTTNNSVRFDQAGYSGFSANTTGMICVFSSGYFALSAEL